MGENQQIRKCKSTGKFQLLYPSINEMMSEFATNSLRKCLTHTRGNIFC